MKKKILALTAAAVMALSALPASGAEEIPVYVDGEKLIYDQPPVIKENRTLVPMRVIFEALDASVEWDSKEKKVTASWKDDGLELIIGEDEIKLASGKVIELDVPAQIINSRTMVPLRAVSEAMGKDVTWDPDARAIYIEKNFTPMDVFRFFNELGYIDESYLENGLGDFKEIEINDGTDGAFAGLLAYYQSYELDLNMIFEEYVWGLENGAADDDVIIDKGTFGDGFYVIYRAMENRIYMYMVSRDGDVVRELTTFYFEGGESEYLYLCERFFKTIETWKEPKG